MGLLPENIQWYIADIVMQIQVEGCPGSVVHTNMTLVQASSNEEAYKKAVQLGQESEQHYENIDGKQVEFIFRGLHDLNLIHDDLEHGAELIYSEKIDMDEAKIEACLTSKKKLGVFAPRQASKGPDYSSGDIVRKMLGIIEEKGSDNQYHTNE